MAKRMFMNTIHKKPTLSVSDEKEYRKADAAARWLEKNDKGNKRYDKPRKK